VYASKRSADPRLSFMVGDAVTMKFPAGSFDRCYSLLALNFMSDPRRALAGMVRATRQGGSVAAAVWDFPGGLVYQRIFWDTAAALDPAASQARARQYSAPLLAKGALEAALLVAGFSDVTGNTITMRMDYEDFADYWEPIAAATGPVGDYVRSTDPGLLADIRSKTCEAYLSGLPDGPRSMAASAWVATGRR